MQKSILILTALASAVMLTACQAPVATSAMPAVTSNTNAVNGMQSTVKSVQLKTARQGAGKFVSVGDDVLVKYVSYDVNGKVIDGTMDGKAVWLPVSSMFAGLQQGLMQMQAGGAYELYIPASVGYSDDEKTAKQPIIYRMEVLQIKRM